MWLKQQRRHGDGIEGDNAMRNVCSLMVFLGQSCNVLPWGRYIIGKGYEWVCCVAGELGAIAVVKLVTDVPHDAIALL